MKKTTQTILGTALVSALGSAHTAGADAADIAEALGAGEVKLHLRARYEDVSEQTFEDASATTLKTRLTYTSGTYQGLGLTLEMDDIRALRSVNYSDGVEARGTAVIPDPEVTEVNQAFLSYSNEYLTARYGRQRILLDNQRFVGGVGWRQDEQTFDALSVSSAPVEDIAIFYAYISQVNRIFAETQDHNHDSHLFNARYRTPFGTLIGYAYLLDNESVVNWSSDTYGLRWQGRAGDYISYNLEYATQSDGGGSTLDYAADYWLAEALGNIPVADFRIDLKAGHEVLGSDGGTAAFTTSLATLHAFQGWTDRFLLTPADGIEDTYLSIGSKLGPVNATLTYHWLSANEGSADYGTELGLTLGTQAGPVALLFKYADYSADIDLANAPEVASASPFNRDTRKLWLMASATF